MEAVIVSGGSIGHPDFYRRLIDGRDLIICADKGADTVRSLGLTPHIVVGDFDSISPGTEAWLEENNVPTRRYPPEKDKTDCELALDQAIDSGADRIILTAAWGGRFDQAAAHMFLLKSVHKRGISCYISEEAGDIHLVEESLEITGRPGDTVSLLAIEETSGLRLTGLKYPALTGCLPVGSTLGVSNIMMGDRGRIELKQGSVLVFHLRGEHEKAS